jgi:hypothetical protein
MGELGHQAVMDGGFGEGPVCEDRENGLDDLVRWLFFTIQKR